MWSSRGLFVQSWRKGVHTKPSALPCLFARWSHVLSCVLRGITFWNGLVHFCTVCRPSSFLLRLCAFPGGGGWLSTVSGRGTTCHRASPPWSFAERASEWGRLGAGEGARSCASHSQGRSGAFAPGPSQASRGAAGIPQTCRRAVEAAAHGPAAHKAARRARSVAEEQLSPGTPSALCWDGFRRDEPVWRLRPLRGTCGVPGVGAFPGSACRLRR